MNKPPDKLITALRELPPGTVIKKEKNEWYMYVFHEPSGITHARDPDIGTCTKEFITLLRHKKELA